MARYERVADSIRDQISEGVLSQGDQLPTEPLLVEEYGVSRLTVRHALDVLQAEGLIEKIHGRGSFVRRPLRRMTYVGGWPSCEAPADDVPIDTWVKVSTVKAEAEIAGLMRVEAGAELSEYLYVSQREGHPYGTACVYVPAALSDFVQPSGSSPWGTEVRDDLTAAGVRLTRTMERITTRTPTQEEANRLALPSGASVLAIERTSVDEHDCVAEGARLVMPGDRVEAVFTTTTTEPARR